MNDLLVSLWGPNWLLHLIVIFLFVLLLNVIGMVIRRWRLWREFRLTRYFSAEDLQSVQHLLYLVKLNAYWREERTSAHKD